MNSIMTTKPIALIVAPEQLPSELTDLPFVNWRWERDGGDWKKPPIQPNNPKRYASPTNRETWGGFSEAAANLGRPDVDGLGVILDGTAGLVGLDFDKCADPLTGAIRADVQTWIARLASYTEFSPSGTGIRIFVRGVLPVDGKRDAQQGVEVYQKGRYLTVTGQRLPTTSATIVHNQAALDDFYSTYFGGVPGPIPTPISASVRASQSAPTRMSDEEAVRLACADGKTGEQFRDLYHHGNWQQYFGSRWQKILRRDSNSEADMWFLGRLAYFTGPESGEQLVRIFRRSALGKRGKVSDESSGYGYRTARKAIDGHKGVFYRPKQQDMTHPSSKQTKLSVVSAGEFLHETMEEARWVVDGLLACGGISFLAAYPKIGKSTLTYALALSKARGLDFLNRPTSPGKVLLIALEEHRGQLRAKLQTMGLNQDDQIDIHTGIVQASDELARVIREGGYALVIIDPFAMFVGFTEINSNSEGYEKMVPLLNAVRNSDAHLLIVHHSGKGQGRGIKNLLGGTSLAGSVDAVFLLERVDGKVWLSTDGPQRYGIELPPTELHYDPQTQWVSGGVTSSTQSQQAMQDRILDLLKGGDQWTTMQIRSALGKEAAGELDAMVKAKLIEVERPGGNARIYRLRSNEPVGSSEFPTIASPVHLAHAGDMVELSEFSEVSLN